MMDRAEVIRMAREAGFTRLIDGMRDNGDSSEYWDCWPEQLERFAALVAARERERCAKVCDIYVDWHSENKADSCADTIRALP